MSEHCLYRRRQGKAGLFRGQPSGRLANEKRLIRTVWVLGSTHETGKRTRYRIPPGQFNKGNTIGIGTLLLIVLILVLIGAIPVWPYSRGWGYGPSGGVGLLVVILIVLLVTGLI